MSNINTESKVIQGLAPVADAFSASIVSTAVNMKTFSRANFFVIKGVGVTGTSTVTLTKATDGSGTTEAAIPFYYRRITNAGVAGAWTLATTTGFTTTAGSAETYELAITDQMEGLALGDKPFVRLKATEVVDSPVLGGVMIVASGGRYGLSG